MFLFYFVASSLPIAGSGPPTTNVSNVPILNMNNLNAVRATAVNFGAVTMPTGAGAQMAGQPQKAMAPRMIINPQMLAGSRPGAPGVS